MGQQPGGPGVEVRSDPGTRPSAQTDGFTSESRHSVHSRFNISHPKYLLQVRSSQLDSVGGSPPFIPDGNAPTNTSEPYLPFLDFILDQESIPQTFTTSYGDDEQSVPYDYAVAVCNGFAKLGARGTSVIFSSGDCGVGGGDCATNDGKNRTEFLPVFSATYTCLAPESLG